ncbi:MAG: DUF4388 domain-containing protein [Myxococcales bacterium]|jgi:hypothetical protein|nr:DUF4388 domain-containing protein [Myxococcales bacterium]
MDPFLWLRSDGALLPENEETRALIGPPPRRFRLLPTSPHLLVGLRMPCEPVLTNEERVVFVGDVAGVSLIDFIVFLNQSRLSGLLRVTAPEGERSLAFLDGELRGVSSSLPSEKIGEVAVRIGLVEREALDALLARPNDTGRIGNLMVESGLLQRHDLYTCLRQQVTEIFQACLMLTDGVYYLTNQKISAQRALSFNTQGLLMDSVRQIDEMREFRKKIPSSKACPRASKAADDKLTKLTPSEAQVLRKCNGTCPIIELARMFQMSEFEATKVVHTLLEQGYIDADMAIAQSSRLSPKQIIGAFNEIFALIFGSQQNPPKLIDEASNVLMNQSELFPMLKGIQLQQGTGTLPAEQLLRNIEAHGGNAQEATRLLFSILSELMYFLLFEAGEQLDSAAEEQLSARIKALFASIEAAGR